ncbi:methyl-accepting chemotaxis protein [soil metagenome]
MKPGMTISKKFMVACGTLLFTSLLQAILAMVGFNAVRHGIESMVSTTVPGIVSSSQILEDLYVLRGDYMRHMLSTDVADMARLEDADASALRKLHEDMHVYEVSITQDVDRQNFARVTPEVEKMLQVWETILPISRQGRSADAYALYTVNMMPIMTNVDARLTDIARWNKDGQDTTSAAVTASANRAWWLTLSVTLIALALGSGITWYMVRGINSMLRTAIVELSNGAERMAAAATQVTASSQALAHGSSQQAASIEETSASTSEVNSMAMRATENSRSTADIVSQSQEKFSQTNHSLEQMLQAMDGITSSSGKISKIIKVIDEIAFQTNILALNAAVEAARAGTAGAGFAVVAEEVRNLAQRCAQAASDTAELIDDSITKANNGRTKVDEVASAIRAITLESARMKILVDEINQSSQEQARGIGHISTSILQMEQVTQGTAASAQQSAAAAEELSALSEAMRTVVQDINTMVGGDFHTQLPHRRAA